MKDWLSRFRDDRPARPSPSDATSRRQPGNSTSAKAEERWLDKFRDDEAHSEWLARFRDDEPEGKVKADPKSARGAPVAGPSRHIRLFEWLMYISLFLEVATTASDFPRLAQLVGSWLVAMLPDLFTVTFFGVFIFAAVYLRQKWALYVVAAFYAIRLLGYIVMFNAIELPLAQFLIAVQFILQGLALFYAFSGDAPAHFARKKR